MANRAIADAIFSYVSMITVAAVVSGCKTVTPKHVEGVEDMLAAKQEKHAAKPHAKAQKGGNGIDFTGLSAGSYSASASHAAGTNASAVDFAKGVARPEHALAGSGSWAAEGGNHAATAKECTASIHAAITKEVEHILKDHNVRKKAGVVALITEKIEMRVTAFLHPLVSGSSKPLRIQDVKAAAKSAFRGLRIIFA